MELDQNWLASPTPTFANTSPEVAIGRTTIQYPVFGIPNLQEFTFVLFDSVLTL